MKRLVIFAAIAFSLAQAEESKGMWQRFVDFFSPSSSVEGKNDIEKEIQKVEKKIQTTKNDFNREHRPQRKSMLRKELDDLNHTRDSLFTILEQQNVSSNGTVSSSSEVSVSSVAESSSSEAVSSSSVISSSSKDESSSSVQEICKPVPAEHCDTVWVIEKRIVHDTVFVHDTVYVQESKEPQAPLKEQAKEQNDAQAVQE